MTATTSEILSPWLGEIQWEAGCELHFPAGLPGFEAHKRIVPVEIPSQRPLIYLQSGENAEVCFLALPVLTINPGFDLVLAEDDRAMLEFDQPTTHGETLSIGSDVLCLALLMPSGPTVQTNLSAPIVINLHNGRGIQVVASGAAKSWRLSQHGGWESVC